MTTTKPNGRPKVPEPHPGMIFEAYMYRRGLGGGVRLFLVLSVGRKFITLFYPPRLMQVKLTRAEWEAMGFVERAAQFTTVPAFIHSIQVRANEYARLGRRFSNAVVKQAIELCGGHYYVPPSKIEVERK